MYDDEKKEFENKIDDLEKNKRVLEKDLVDNITVKTDLIIENDKLNNENNILTEKNKELKKQIKDTEDDALKLIDIIYEMKYPEKEDAECTFNKNGSCLFFDVMQDTIKKVIKILNEVRAHCYERKDAIMLDEVLIELEGLTKFGE